MNTTTAPRSTCAGCPNLAKNRIPMNGVVCSCAVTGFVIPHHSKAGRDAWELTYWRVPENCPLPDSEVRKSAERAPVGEWYTETVDPNSLPMIKIGRSNAG